MKAELIKYGFPYADDAEMNHIVFSVYLARIDERIHKKLSASAGKATCEEDLERLMRAVYCIVKLAGVSPQFCVEWKAKVRDPNPGNTFLDDRKRQEVHQFFMIQQPGQHFDGVVDSFWKEDYHGNGDVFYWSISSIAWQERRRLFHIHHLFSYATAPERESHLR